MSEDNAIQNVFVHKMQDNDLVTLVRLANEVNYSAGITLLSKGSLITGMIISGKEYYEKIAAAFLEAGANNASTSVSEYFSNAANEIYTKKDDNEEHEIPVNFMHLKDVSFKSGDGHYSKIDGGYLRVKIEEIDGHMIGISSTD